MLEWKAYLYMYNLQKVLSLILQNNIGDSAGETEAYALWESWQKHLEEGSSEKLEVTDDTALERNRIKCPSFSYDIGNVVIILILSLLYGNIVILSEVVESFIESSYISEDYFLFLTAL